MTAAEPLEQTSGKEAPLIAFENITKTYGQGASAFTALKGVNFQIDAGEFVAIMGPQWFGQVHGDEYSRLP